MIFSKLRAFLKKICQCVSIVNFFQPNYSKGKIYVLQHFKKTTIYKILSHSGIYKVLIRFDLNGIINWIKKCAQEINTEIITSMFKNLKPKIHQAIKFGLTSLLRYVINYQSMNYKNFVTKIMLKSLKNFLFHFFMNRSLRKILSKYPLPKGKLNRYT